MFDSVVSVYKTIGDINFYVTGDQDENEIILLTVLQAFYEAVTMLLRRVARPTLGLLRWLHLCH